MKFFCLAAAVLLAPIGLCSVSPGRVAAGDLPPLAEANLSFPDEVTSGPPQEGEYGPRGFYQRFRTRKVLRITARKVSRPHIDPVPSGQVQVIKDVPYGPACGHRLDLYLPAEQPFPVVVYVHGGSWIAEDKSFYTMMGQYLAEHGVGAVLINYRLPPEVSVEGEAEDAASGFAWTYRNIAGYGGNPERVFLCGHSSGGHLVAVLATNSSYLGREGLTPDRIRGVIGIAGVYNIPLAAGFYGVGYVFRDTNRAALSPVKQVQPGVPPILLIYCGKGNYSLRYQAWNFHHELQKNGCEVESFKVPHEDHYGEVLNIADPDDQLGPRILEFIACH